MAFNRLERIKQEVKREMSSIVRELKDPRISPMTSIVAADVSRDLKYAKIYVSVMGTDEEKRATMDALKSATGFIKRKIGSRLDLRCVPQPTFVLDSTIDYGMHINELIHKINGEEK